MRGGEPSKVGIVRTTVTKLGLNVDIKEERNKIGASVVGTPTTWLSDKTSQPCGNFRPLQHPIRVRTRYVLIPLIESGILPLDVVSAIVYLTHARDPNLPAWPTFLPSRATSTKSNTSLIPRKKQCQPALPAHCLPESKYLCPPPPSSLQ